MEMELSKTAEQVLSNFGHMLSTAGSEKSAIEKFYNAIQPLVDEVTVDILGNCIAHKKGDGPKVMITAHADEVGIMIHYVDDKGFLYFKPVGGVDPYILLGRPVIIKGRDGVVVGIVGRDAIHMQWDKQKELEFEDLWIDIQANDKEDALKQIQIGDTGIVYSAQFTQNGCVSSNALDDKAGMTALYRIAELLQNETINYDLYLVATVQEEIGLRGAKTAAFEIDPYYGFAIDVTHATDYPHVSREKFGDIKLGKGAVITTGPNVDKQLFNQLKTVADGYEIPYQIEGIPRATGTDANAIQVSRCGVKTGVLSIPCRYMHTPFEVVALSDIEAVSQVMKYWLCEPVCENY